MFHRVLFSGLGRAVGCYGNRMQYICMLYWTNKWFCPVTHHRLGLRWGLRQTRWIVLPSYLPASCISYTITSSVSHSDWINTQRYREPQKKERLLGGRGLVQSSVMKADLNKEEIKKKRHNENCSNVLSCKIKRKKGSFFFELKLKHCGCKVIKPVPTTILLFIWLMYFNTGPV